METSATKNLKTTSGVGAGVWIGRVVSALVILFLLFDGAMKIIKEQHSVDGSVALGWPENAIIPIGVVLFLATIIYTIPRTSVIGAVLLTGYLGGAMAIMISANQPFYFALTFGILVWLGLYLRDAKLRTFISNL